MSKRLSVFCLSLLTITLLSVFLIPFIAFGQKFVPLTGPEVSKIDLAPYMTQAFAGQSLTGFVNAMFRAALAVGAMLAVLQLARAGFYYMGSDVWAKKEQGKQLIRDAVIGLLILLSIWLILNQINPQLLNLDVLNKIEKLPTQQKPAQEAQNVWENGWTTYDLAPSGSWCTGTTGRCYSTKEACDATMWFFNCSTQKN